MPNALLKKNPISEEDLTFPKGLIARMDMMPAGFYRLVSHPGKKE